MSKVPRKAGDAERKTGGAARTAKDKGGGNHSGAPTRSVAHPSGKATAKDPKVIYRRVSIDDVFEDPANARKHGAENLTAIKASLRSFGQVEPLIVQRSSMKVIGGNGRLKVMRQLGWTEVDIADTDIDNASAAALGIALNRTSELATWDADALDQILREIETGDEDLQAMLSKLAEDEKLIPQDEPEAPEDFKGVGEDIDVNCTCPKCGYQWSDGT